MSSIQKYPDRLTRLEVALENKVDGLVIYNNWRGINLSNGTFPGVVITP
ncbi:hypothetical protein [Marinilabilia rubra]|nr:hypothetical protein [Marinilabilia rubra]